MENNDIQIIQINENSWRIENAGVRFFLLTGGEKALLVDSGMTVRNAREIAASLTDLPLELFNTHADRDHVGSNGEFDRFYMHPADEAQYRQGGGAGELIPVQDGDVLDLGGRRLRVIGLPGHTPGSVALLDEAARVLISGDPIQQGTIFMFGKARNLRDYVESLRRLSREHRDQIDEIWPSHGVFPVGFDTVDLVLDCGEKLLRGEARGELVEFHGTKILKVDFGKTAFLCDMAE